MGWDGSAGLMLGEAEVLVFLACRKCVPECVLWWGKCARGLGLRAGMGAGGPHGSF